MATRHLDTLLGTTWTCDLDHAEPLDLEQMLIWIDELTAGLVGEETEQVELEPEDRQEPPTALSA